MLRSLLNVAPARPLAVAVFLVLAGCEPAVELPDDDAACAGVQCTAGQCFSNAGQPMCRCGDWEQAAGLPCQVASFVVEDDHACSPAQASALDVSSGPREGRISANMHPSPDRDLFAFQAEEGHSYIFICEPGSLPTCFPRLLDAAGLQRSSRPLEGKLQGQWLFGPLAAGTWYVEVSGAGQTGTYTYELLDTGLDDFGNGPEQATSREPSEKPFLVTSTFSGDRDVIRFHAMAGHGYRFRCELPRPDAGLSMRLLDDTSKVVTTAEGLGQHGRAPTVELKVSRDSEWFVEVVSTQGAMPTPFSCSLTDLGLDEHADSPVGATALRPGVPVSVRMHSNYDVDMLAFTTQPGHSYALRQQPAGQLVVRLANAEGKLVDMLDQGAFVTPDPRQPGTYHLVVSPARSASQDAPVQLVLEDLGLDDHGNTSPEATHAAVDTSVAGRFHSARDVDAIAFVVEDEGIYQLTCEPGCRVSGPDFSMEWLHTRTFGVSYTQSVTFLVAWQQGTPETYTVKVERVGTDDHGDGWHNATHLVLPAAVAGQFEVGNDVDSFSVDLELGRTYRLVQTQPGMELRVQGPDGYYLWSMDGRLTPRFTGRYQVWVRPVDPSRYGAWGFRLQAE